jgi:alkylation response protein AidB-like acyl-CoA dehydrogenase
MNDSTGSAELAERFAPVFAKITEGSPDREVDRRLPYDELSWLREAGLGKLRVPRSPGGLGANLPRFFRLLIELGKSGSNLPQLLRGHLGFVETRLVHADPDVRDRWLRRIADGVDHVLNGISKSAAYARSWERIREEDNP